MSKESLKELQKLRSGLHKDYDNMRKCAENSKKAMQLIESLMVNELLKEE